ncbi:MAG: 3'-5' exonuclease [Lachnospiraceae bacterium]|nr:3'-5' exonuclease [Lachnospiraceae bacterium]
MIKTFVSIDLETTGLHPKEDRITEIGAIKYQDGAETGRFHSLINPGRKLEERIVQLTGITDEELAQAPHIEKVLPELLEFLGDLPLLGHSILFDYSFLKKAAVDLKLPFEKRGIDTLKIAKKYLAQLEHRNLGFLCGYYRIPLQAHRALWDAEATAILYGKLAEEFYSDEEPLFFPQPLIFRIKRDTPATKAQKEQLYRLMERHRIQIDRDVEYLTRSEASRITDRILSGQMGEGMSSGGEFR